MRFLHVIQRFMIIISEQAELDSDLRIRMFAFHKGVVDHTNVLH